MKKTSLLVRGSALTLALFSAMPAIAQEDTIAADETAEAASEGTIVVTGSRIRRPNLDSTLPITSSHRSSPRTVMLVASEVQMDVTALSCLPMRIRFAFSIVEVDFAMRKI